MASFHAVLRLRARRADERDAELRANAAKVREWRVAPRQFVGRRRPQIDVLPVGIQGARHAVRRDPRLQDAASGPEDLFSAKVQQCAPGRVIDHRHHARAGATAFEPVMKTPVELYALHDMGFARAALMARPRPAHTRPHLRRSHPPGERRDRHQDPVIGPQVLGRERRAEALPGPARRRAPVVDAHELEHLRAIRKRQRDWSPGRYSRGPGPSGPPRDIGRQPPRVAITHAEYHRRVLDRDLLRDDAPQHRRACELSIAHGGPLHFALLVGGPKLGDSSTGARRGHCYGRSTVGSPQAGCRIDPGPHLSNPRDHGLCLNSARNGHFLCNNPNATIVVIFALSQEY